MTNPLEEMYQAYKDPVFRYLLNMCHSRTIAEELTHDTFIKAFKGFGRFRGESSLKTWLFKIARNTYLNEVNKFSQKNELPYAEPELQSGGTIRNIETEMMVICIVLGSLPLQENTSCTSHWVSRLSSNLMRELPTFTCYLPSQHFNPESFSRKIIRKS